MHISEGVLSAPVLIGSGVLAVGGTIIGLRRIEQENVMPAALLSAAFFVASLVHVPIGPASVHLVLTGLLGLVLGWGCFPAILVGLFLQAVFFQFGGLTVLGANTVTMATPAVFCHYLVRRWMEQPGTRMPAAFAAGFLAILFSALLTAAVLDFSNEGFAAAAKMLIIANMPIMVIEGCVTMFTVAFIAKVQPEILQVKTAS
ncbi:cobalt transporter CbiM [Candidatus Electronema sp. JM]|uniref:cobalt transporter CbiM n=1 Tax=Candidatus Electronema sp. JM TaxID=3401571 RepID=UPI003AA821F8